MSFFSTSSSSSIVLLLLGISSKIRDACTAVSLHDSETASICLNDAYTAFSSIPKEGVYVDFAPLRSELIRLYNSSRAVGATDSRASAAILLTLSCRGNASASGEAIACASRTVSCLEKENKFDLANTVSDAALTAHTLSGTSMGQLLFGVELELYFTSIWELYLFKVRILDGSPNPTDETVVKSLKEILTLHLPSLIAFLPHERKTLQLSLFERGRILLDACNFINAEHFLTTALTLGGDEKGEESNQLLCQQLLLTLACCAAQRLDETDSISRASKYLSESKAEHTLMGQLVQVKLKCKTGQLDIAMSHVQAMLSLALGKSSSTTLGLIASALRTLAIARRFDVPSMKIYATAVSSCYPTAPESVLIRFDLLASLILSLRANGVASDDALKDVRASFLLQQIIESHSKDKLPLPVLTSVLSFLDAGMRTAYENNKYNQALEITKRLIELAQSLDPLSLPMPLADLYKVCSQCCLHLGLTGDAVFTAKKAQELDDSVSSRFLVLYTLCKETTSPTIDTDLEAALNSLMAAKDFQQRHLLAAFEELSSSGETKSKKRLTLARNTLRFLIDSTCLSGYDVSTVHPSLNAFALVRLLVGVDRDCRTVETSSSSKESTLEAMRSTVAILVIAGKCKEVNSRINESSRTDLVWCLHCAWAASLSLRNVAAHSSCIDAAAAFNTFGKAFFLSRGGGSGGGRRQRSAIMLDMASSILQAISSLCLGDDMRGVASSHVDATSSRSFYERALTLVSHCNNCYGELQPAIEEAPLDVKDLVAQSDKLLCDLLKEEGGNDKAWSVGIGGSLGGTDSLLCLLELHARARLVDPKAATAPGAYKKLESLLDCLISSRGVSTILLIQASDILRQPPSSSRELASKALSAAIDFESALMQKKQPSSDTVCADMSMMADDDVAKSLTLGSSEINNIKKADIMLIATLLRRLLLLSQTKLDSFVVFKRALRVIQQTLTQSDLFFPREEADWLAVTAWNTGVFFCRMGAASRGEPFLAFAVEEMAPVVKKLCAEDEEYSETLSSLQSMKAQLTGVRDGLLHPADTPAVVSASLFTTPNLQALLAPKAPQVLLKHQQQPSSSISVSSAPQVPPIVGASVRPLYFYDDEVEEVDVEVAPTEMMMS
jgi:hypothetical protein